MSAPKSRKTDLKIQQVTVGFYSFKGGDPAAPSDTATLLRLHPNHQPQLRRLSPLRVELPTSVAAGFRGVTGGVYKARERIHRSLLICDY